MSDKGGHVGRTRKVLHAGGSGLKRVEMVEGGRRRQEGITNSSATFEGRQRCYSSTTNMYVLEIHDLIRSSACHGAS